MIMMIKIIIKLIIPMVMMMGVTNTTVTSSGIHTNNKIIQSIVHTDSINKQTQGIEKLFSSLDKY